LYYKIQELEGLPHLSKHESLVNGILDSINEKVLERGDLLPSVNKMVHELGYARKTIVKAYDELKERGIVESRNRLGYFIATEATTQKLKVALLLYAFHTFQEIFYNTFRKAVGDNIQLDIFFHHNNKEVFRDILQNVKNKYGLCVVAPIQHNPESVELLKSIPPSKLLLIDRNIALGEEYSSISQEFASPFYQVLCELKDKIETYDSLTLIFKEEADYPEGIKHAFEKFCRDFGLRGNVETEYHEGSLEKGRVYFTIGDTELWNILKDCKSKGYTIGKDVGILSQNDSPVKEIIEGGISTFSTDFRLMAQEAANFILDRKKTQKVIPSLLIRRNSL
ncbi:MAG: GntR family transcriptional regulator, partial [Bacteroidota bacterium]